MVSDGEEEGWSTGWEPYECAKWVPQSEVLGQAGSQGVKEVASRGDSHLRFLLSPTQCTSSRAECTRGLLRAHVHFTLPVPIHLPTPPSLAHPSDLTQPSSSGPQGPGHWQPRERSWYSVCWGRTAGGRAAGARRQGQGQGQGQGWRPSRIQYCSASIGWMGYSRMGVWVRDPGDPLLHRFNDFAPIPDEA